jgi:HD-GYP domain-containing protein (c-di-GMP phosphodiesterase class II)
MNDRAIRTFIRELRRASGYIRLYGHDHGLSNEAIDEATRSGTDLIGTQQVMTLGVLDDTLFVDGETHGLISLQFNSFLRDVAAVGIETLVMTSPLDRGDVGALVRTIAGEAEGFQDGTTIRINSLELEGDGSLTTGALLRRSYSRSLNAVRRFGRAVAEDRSATLDETAAVVGELLERSMANPAAAMLLTTVKSHHEYTFYHSVNTSILSLGLARLAGFSEQDQVMVGVGAMLHDIGKIGVPTSILQYPGRLDTEQWEEIRNHPQLGAEAILAAASPGEEIAAAVALEHHARYDGMGYPRLVYHGGAGDFGTHPLHCFSRLVAVADTYDAITTRRSYRRAEPPSRALQVLLSEAGTSYDPDFVLAFTAMMGIYPPGSFLRLTSGAVAMVTKPSAEADGVPEAVLVRDRWGTDLAEPEPVVYSREEIAEHVTASAIDLQPVRILDRMTLDG